MLSLTYSTLSSTQVNLKLLHSVLTAEVHTLLHLASVYWKNTDDGSSIVVKLSLARGGFLIQTYNNSCPPGDRRETEEIVGYS